MSAAIFRGEVIAVSPRRVPFIRGDGKNFGDVDIWLVRLAVERTWKGVDTQEATVAIIAHGDACGRDTVSLGERWLVFAWDYAGGLETDKCASRTVSEQDLTELLGSGDLPSAPGRGPEPRSGAPASFEPPLRVHPRHTCACSTLTLGAASSSEDWLSPALLMILAASWQRRRRPLFGRS